MTARLIAYAAVLLTGMGVLAGCGSSGSHAASSVPAAKAPLATSMTEAGGGTWAIVAMGGSAATENRFWELFTRPAAGGGWELVTPPGVADNGGLVAADVRSSVTVAIRPSQGLSFSPLALTSNGGKTWGTGLIDAPVANVPDAFAVSADGTMLALLDNGTVEQAGDASTGTGTGWSRLAAPGTVAASPAGRRCQVTSLTGVAYNPSGTPLVAASCTRPGVAGVFARSGNTWAAAGPTVPGGRPAQVLRLVGTPTGDVALIQTGTGGAATLFAAWTSDGTRWTVSPPLPAGSQAVQASGTGAAGTVWVLLADGRAETIAAPSAPRAAPGAAWRELAAPPAGTATLAALPGGTFDALVSSGGKLAVYQLGTAGGWAKNQAISVPIEYGSSS